MSKKSCDSSGERCKRGFANGRGLNGRRSLTILATVQPDPRRLAKTAAGILLDERIYMDKEYLLRERPGRALFLFALPMIIGNLFQQFYTVADSMVVGRYVSEHAPTAARACSLPGLCPHEAVYLHGSAGLFCLEYPAGPGWLFLGNGNDGSEIGRASCRERVYPVV